MPAHGPRDARPATLDNTGKNVADDKDRGEFTGGEAQDLVVGRREDGADETSDEEVVSGSDENWGDDNEAEGEDKGDLGRKR